MRSTKFRKRRQSLWRRASVLHTKMRPIHLPRGTVICEKMHLTRSWETH